MALSLKMVYGPEQKAKRLTVVYAQENTLLHAYNYSSI